MMTPDLSVSQKERAAQVWEELLEGNRRFYSGQSHAYQYSPEQLEALATAPARPMAVVIACGDSRVCPEILFDQPLGALFVTRAPGNCATEGVRWSVELAVGELGVPLVVVLGHTGCLAIKQIIDGRIGGPGGSLRLTISHAVHKARMQNAPDLWRQSVVENVTLSAQELVDNLAPVRKGLEAHTVAIVNALYDMSLGRVETISWR
jgi:carbonic anhydrase